MNNNRNYPPQPQFPNPRQNAGAYAPPRILMGLIGQSEKRYMFLREAAMKLDAGFGDLGMVFEDEPLDPMMREDLQEIFGLGNYGKQQLESLMKYELHLQGALKRILMGRPLRRAPYSQGAPPSYLGPYRGPDPSQQQMMPPPQQQMMQQQKPQQPSSQPQIPPEMMAAPQGPVDYRDPKQAAAALLRAQPMPLGPGSTQAQLGGAYVPPGAYGVAPPQVPYGVPPGAYVAPPSQVPVVQAAPETATQVMQQSQPAAVPAVNVPAAQPNGATKNATS